MRGLADRLTGSAEDADGVVQESFVRLVAHPPDARGRCSFEALAEKHRPDDVSRQELGRIVHGADFADEVHATPESIGLRSISRGFPLVAADDHELVERASFVYDALYAALRERKERAI